MLNGLANAQTLREQIGSMLDLLDSIDDHLDSLDAASQTMTADTKDVIIPIFLSSDGRATLIDNRELIIRRAVFGTSGLDRYQLVVGTDISLRWQQNANTTFPIITADAPVIIPRGLAVTIRPVSTTPTWDLLLWCVAGDVPGSVNVRQ